MSVMALKLEGSMDENERETESLWRRMGRARSGTCSPDIIILVPFERLREALCYHMGTARISILVIMARVPKKQ